MLSASCVVNTVEDQCHLGCSGLVYCSNFNHRPTELFRSCTKRADDAASSLVRLWESGTISLPMLLPYNIPVKGIGDIRPTSAGSEAKASVPGASDKLGGRVRDFSPWASSAMEASKETKFGTKVAWAWGWCPNFEYTHDAEKARNTTLDDENASQHVTSVSVAALCDQPEAFASDLSDDQSRYLWRNRSGDWGSPYPKWSRWHLVRSCHSHALFHSHRTTVVLPISMGFPWDPWDLWEFSM